MNVICTPSILHNHGRRVILPFVIVIRQSFNWYWRSARLVERLL